MKLDDIIREFVTKLAISKMMSYSKQNAIIQHAIKVADEAQKELIAKVKQWAIGELPESQHLCPNCGLTDEEAADAVGFNRCIQKAKQNINEAN